MKVSCCVLFAEVLKSESPGGSTEDGGRAGRIEEPAAPTPYLGTLPVYPAVPVRPGTAAESTPPSLPTNA
jgi:hypothetical protein